MYRLCSLWDEKYHSRGLALYHSLVKYVKDFELYVLCFESETYFDLLKLDRCIPIFYNTWKTDATERAKLDRSWVEWLWTLTPWLVKKCLSFGLKDIAYIDADCYFFSDPNPLYEEVKGNSIAIIPHRFTPSLRDWLIPAGEYNVSWVYFNSGGMSGRCLDLWESQCLAWCKATPENGNYGDQVYLNAWPALYGAHVVEHIGAGLAPWNQMQYNYHLFPNGQLAVNNQPVIFFHFHGLDKSDYKIHPMVTEHLYKPYRKELDNGISGNHRAR